MDVIGVLSITYSNEKDTKFAIALEARTSLFILPIKTT